MLGNSSKLHTVSAATEKDDSQQINVYYKSDHAKRHMRERRERTEEYMSHDRIIRLLQEVFSKVTESISWTRKEQEALLQPCLLIPLHPGGKPSRTS